MRIAFYAPLKSPTHSIPSGDRRVARLLMDALALAGHDVRLVSDFRSFDGRGDAVAQRALRDQAGVIVRDLLEGWRDAPCSEWPELWMTYHLYYKAPDWLGPPVCRALGLPYVVVEASFAPKRAQGAWADGHAAVFDALRQADLLLCPTGEDVPALQAVVGSRTPVRRLPPFLDPAPYARAAERRAVHRIELARAHDLDPRSPWIIVAAMMRPGDKQASYDMLADALQRLGDVPWMLLVAGDGPAGPAVRARLNHSVPGRCRFLGACDADALAALYAACDLCVWPAVNEAYGMAMLEAQAAGLPVVSCAVRGVPEVVVDGATGLLAPEGDVAQFAAHVRTLLLDASVRQRMGREAARFVAQERSLAQAARRLQDALAGLVARSAPAASSGATA